MRPHHSPVHGPAWEANAPFSQNQFQVERNYRHMCLCTRTYTAVHTQAHTGCQKEESKGQASLPPCFPEPSCNVLFPLAGPVRGPGGLYLP